MDQQILIAIYGLLQKELRLEGLLDEYAAPLKSKDAVSTECINLYKWLAEALIRVPESTLNEEKEYFNDIVKGLTADYYLNNLLFSLFLFEGLVSAQGTVPQKIVLMPKISRAIKDFRKELIEGSDENAIAISQDSKRAATNIIRHIEKRPEITKAMSQYRLNKWKEAVTV